MNSAGWFLLVGGLMLAMGLTAPLIKRFAVTSAMLYLSVGLLVGPTGFELFHFNPLQQSALLEVLTEVVVLISLFSAGVKMPVPVTWARWSQPVLLAFVSMTLSVALVAGFSHYVLGLSLGAAVLMGAILAPTDPVLATDVQIRHAEDRDRLRFSLTCEAGMNDGSAFPFVMLGLGLLGLHDLGSFGQRWWLMDVLWATSAAIAVGWGAGWGLARISVYLRRSGRHVEFLNDFLGLGLIGTVYGICLWINAWGFLAVFFAAVALRQTELKVPEVKPDQLLEIRADTEPAHVSAGSLIFKEHLERLSELVLILFVGGMLFLDSWSWRATGLALFLFIVARPLSVMVGLAGSGIPWRIRGLTAWFGVRGIGSLYYLMYAIEHGIGDELAIELIHLTLVVVALSILLHGVSVKPMMRKFWHRSQQ
ncbi:NhaP-type Na+/H+ or K+/H+ antiporter [Zhongshania antarctica]|uniref:NhaP-type Na+/H+ or K+/H+ antiporter n=1 Tax=Zhongshania antarctica TaxID=641702 RepID=A0A840R7D3_9GAMM|nr:cation:proton antiporter [Zhongshania antarctica]MBB5189219.1 NhaP-type Na+/H+ or K+/H+ antiporter [Zhongshania antarctica]